MLVVHCVGCDSIKRFPVGRMANRNEKQMEGEQVDVENKGYRLWCDREDVVEGLVIGTGDCSSAGAGAGAGAGGIGI